ncbi:hypothetical protein Bbelb_097640 [Branchiostoma belcheri]|nr:hypothetical protein Bbelb_097640 [Branchiostoma belcheri]
MKGKTITETFASLRAPEVASTEGASLRRAYAFAIRSPEVACMPHEAPLAAGMRTCRCKQRLSDRARDRQGDKLKQRPSVSQQQHLSSPQDFLEKQTRATVLEGKPSTLRLLLGFRANMPLRKVYHNPESGPWLTRGPDPEIPSLLSNMRDKWHCCLQNLISKQILGWKKTRRQAERAQ